ncbi:MAG: hypothetical protein ISS52_00240 [Dehalococcoidia bacterium]|nr:hypothetical protein [Dehalococcoidia bacterium]
MQQDLRGGFGAPGGIIGYPLEQLYEEVAYLAYYFHWPLQDILELEHAERQGWVEQIAGINRKLAEMTNSM